MMFRSKSPTYDRLLLVLMFAILVLGVIVLTSASGPLGFQKFNDSYWYIKHQLVFGLLPGLFLFWFFSRLNYQLLKKLAPYIFGVALLLLLAVFIPGLRANWGVTRSWLGLGPFSFQPIELAKLALVIMLAWWGDKYAQSMTSFNFGLLSFVAIIGAVGLLLALQPDAGGFALVVSIAFSVYFAAGASIHQMVLFVLAGLGALAFLIKSAPYRSARLVTFLRPDLDPQGVGYQINQALLAIGSGGLMGLGLGQSRQKYLYLPEVAGDSIFAVMAEEFGLVLTLAALLLLAALMLRMLKIAANCPDKFGQYLVFGVLAWIFFQTLFNISSMLGLMPLTGLPLPFVSFGGTALTMLLAGMGIVASVSYESSK